MRLSVLTVGLASALAADLAAQSAGPAAPSPVNPPGEKFRLRYFFDRDEESLQLWDIKALSLKRLIAAGTYQDRSGRRQGRLAVSDDGGATWRLEPLKDLPRSLSFVNDSLGWMAGASGIWMTEEAGRSWRKVYSSRDLLTVRFTTPLNGFAAGLQKTLLRTTDGGRKWSPVPEAAKPATRRESTAYTAIDFLSERSGVVAGASLPPRREALPAWMEPEEASRRYQRPSVLLVLETRDGGEKWADSIASVFGRVTRLALTPRGFGFALFQFDDKFPFPGEVVRLSLRTGQSEQVFRRADRLITDVAVTSRDIAYLGGIEPSSDVRGIPIPGRVKILRGFPPDYQMWQEIAVDYRAVATRVSLAVSAAGQVWAVTDTGMILALE
jgi:hypothetical protein